MTQRIGGQPLPDAVLHQAATWMMEMREGPLTPAQRQRFERWHQSSAEHAQAWEKATQLLGKLQGVPAAGAIALKNTPTAARRATIKTLAILLAAGPVAWASYRYGPWHAGDDGLATARGERRELLLDDGTRVTLNSATHIALHYDHALREVRLLQGEILVSTARDTQLPARPFIVRTRDGSLRALGTRFTARQQDDRSHLAGYEGAVEITPVSAPQARRIVGTGRQAGFSATNVGPDAAVNEADLAWTDGMLVAEKMPLADFAAELGRYRPGLVQVAPEVAGLPVSGVFPLDDTTASLDLLAQTLPLRVHYLTRYWVRIAAR